MLMQKVATISRFTSSINRIILKPNESHYTNRNIQIVPCKTAITQNSQEHTCVGVSFY